MPIDDAINQPLSGLGIINTRPHHQAISLHATISRLGGECYQFPTIDIIPTSDPESFESYLQQMDLFQLVIFTSANAFWQSEKQYPHLISKLKPLQIAAIGEGTKHALQSAGVEVAILPSQFSSEGLLATPALRQVKNKKILIVTGKDGRDKLAETLSKRQAKVSVAISYERKIAHPQTKPLIQAWQQGKLQAMIVTSNEALRNFMTLLGQTGITMVEQLTLFAVSSRIDEVLKTIPCQHQPVIAEKASDQAIIDAILKWKKVQYDR